MLEQKMIYAVVTVDKANNIQIFKTTRHSKMMDTVRYAIKKQLQYKVLRQAVQG